jgi:hypothetical protein
MPNWCANHISVRGRNPESVEKLADAFDRGEFCQAVIPVPEDQKDNWYDFCVNNWGTKWDISIAEECDRSEDGMSFSGSFDSAWAPPTGVVERLTTQGYDVTLYYHEGGMCYVGKYEDGVDDYYEYSSETSDTVRGVIGEELDDFFGISEQMAEYEADNEEELTRWIKDGAEDRKNLETL